MVCWECAENVYQEHCVVLLRAAPRDAQEIKLCTVTKFRKCQGHTMDVSGYGKDMSSRCVHMYQVHEPGLKNICLTYVGRTH